MIALDTSALVAVMKLEPERSRYLEAISASDLCLISSVTLLEVHLVTFGLFGSAGVDRLDQWLATFRLEVVPFDEILAAAAFAAFKIYGKGVHSKARLNICDCASYALAKTRGLPLLFKGDDFAATDIVAAA